MTKYVCIGELLGLCVGEECHVKDTGSCTGDYDLTNVNYFDIEGGSKDVLDKKGRTIGFKCRFTNINVYKVEVE